MGKPIVKYDAGTVTIIDIEDPAKRQVTFGQTNGEEYIISEPADGSRFLAVQVNFQCAQALCETPPQANLSLNLQDGTSVSYQSSAPPFFITDPPEYIPRISHGEYAKIWFVFEVPRSTNPRSLSVSAEGLEEPLLLTLVNPLIH